MTPLSRRDIRRDIRGRTVLRWAALVSVGLHATALVFLVLVIERSPLRHDAGEAPPMVELRMVTEKGPAPPSGKAPPVPDRTAKTVPPVPAVPVPRTTPAPPQPAVPQAALPPSPPPPPQAEQAEALPLPPPPPLPQVQPAQPRPLTAVPAAAAPPAPNVDESPRINLGGSDSLSNVLVKGDQVIPAGPDTKVHNREPIYPQEAVRRGEQGMVILLVHVAADGSVGGIDIARSSGFDRLDNAAREAVATWRFVPAVQNGQPIASSMPLRIVFQLD